MIKTVLILIITLIVLPIVALKFDQPLALPQLEILKILAIETAAVALYCFAVGQLTGNVSQVDKLWSIVPVIYAWTTAGLSNWNARLILMAVVVTIWGIRLTYNFSRRGAYQLKFWLGEEDYRWAIVRQNPVLQGRFKWLLFNLLFISTYQNILLLMITLPALVAWQGNAKPIGLADILIGCVYVALVIIETIADQQQWNYQTEKHKRLKTGEPLNAEQAQGFISTGLFKWVRHPNYAAEQGIWVTFYFFSVAATGRWINWSMAGCLLLIVLFQSSSDFSESISAKKYAGYAHYKKRVRRFLPRLF